MGKTLTGEALSEDLRLPLYSICSALLSMIILLTMLHKISAGEIVSSGDLEDRLSRIFELARHYKVILLLDEADIFVEQRATQDIQRNRIVCTFLRTLEYYEGIMFLTTNRVKTFDDAIRSRIHLMIKYESLSSANRRIVWQNFLQRTNANYTKRELESLVRKPMNGRDVCTLRFYSIISEI